MYKGDMTSMLSSLFLISILIYGNVISLTIADDVKTQRTIIRDHSMDNHHKNETNVIEIKVNNNPNQPNADNVKVVESVATKSASVATTDTTGFKTNDSNNKPSSTVATITVNIPSGKEQTIEIKNEDKLKDKASEETEKSEGFLDMIIDFIGSDFKLLIKCGAIASALLTQITPINTALTIKRNRCTKNLKILMFATAAFANILWSLYGILTANFIVIISNLPGALVNLLTLYIFHKYCKDQSQKTLIKLFCKVLAASSCTLFFIYIFVTPDNFLTTIGLVGGSLSAISYTAPLVSFNEILESRNTSAIPTEISLGNFIGSFFMFCYGFIIWDLLIVAPSLLGVISGIIQLALLFIFPHTDRIIISEVEILEKPDNFKSILTIDQNL